MHQAPTAPSTPRPQALARHSWELIPIFSPLTTSVLLPEKHPNLAFWFVASALSPFSPSVFITAAGALYSFHRTSAIVLEIP